MSNTEADVICARLDERLSGLSDQLHRIEALVTATNGRVRDLEAWKARADGALLVIGAISTAALAAAAKVLIGP
jgi:hypothetical protein